MISFVVIRLLEETAVVCTCFNTSISLPPTVRDVGICRGGVVVVREGEGQEGVI